NNLVFTAEGEDGVGVSKLEDGQLHRLGSLGFDGPYSSNMVKNNCCVVFVANGKGGLSLLAIEGCSVGNGNPSPSPSPTATPTPAPTATPTPAPTATPTAEPSTEPTPICTPEPSTEPSTEPSATPTPEPSASASDEVDCNGHPIEWGQGHFEHGNGNGYGHDCDDGEAIPPGQVDNDNSNSEQGGPDNG
ncbi:MAG: hypothetical protein ACAI44_38655, partial [Candidatus Sericytochromatia bacterium]